MDYYPFNKQAYDQWVADQGDDTLRLDYNLNKGSVVLDLGGYKGEWGSRIHDMYGSNLFIFEPVTEYFELIKRRFLKNEKVKVFKFGLGAKNESLFISLLNDATSVFQDSAAKEKIEISAIQDFVQHAGVLTVDLIKINIEGGEYDLLEYILNSNMQTSFANIQVQFHRFVPNCLERREKIRTTLSKTHSLTYDYEFIWENWQLKPEINLKEFNLAAI